MKLSDILNSQKFSNTNDSMLSENLTIDDFILELNQHIHLFESLEKLKQLPQDILFTLDRFEGDFAICENRETGKMFDIPKNKIDISSKEGDIIKLENGIYKTDLTQTKKENETIDDKFKRLQNNHL